MIHDREGVFSRVRSFDWAATKSKTASTRAFGEAVLEALREIPPGVEHLTCSGGVDSTVLLYGMRWLDRAVTAHTLAARMDHPDMVHAQLVTHHLGVPHQAHLVPADTPGDKYGVLMQVLREAGVTSVICGDVIDEVLGGYYEHQRSPEAFRRCLDLLIPRHLDALDRCSTKAGIEVYLPYASVPVLSVCRGFPIEGLVTQTARKRPMYRLATVWHLPEAVRLRRKMGLVQALT